jgi:hypothetical protein
VFQLVEAVLACNRHGIAHRDIKLSNITFPLNPYKLKKKTQKKLRNSLSQTILPFTDQSIYGNEGIVYVYICIHIYIYIHTRMDICTVILYLHNMYRPIL